MKTKSQPKTQTSPQDIRMNIKSKIQIVKNQVVISATDLAALINRKPLSVLRAIDAIPAKCLRKDMFVMIGKEVYLLPLGVMLLYLNDRHWRMLLKIERELKDTEHRFYTYYMNRFHAALPPKPVLKVLTWLSSHEHTTAGVLLLRLCYWVKGFDCIMTTHAGDLK
jgi:hypothetical protein